MCAQREKLEDQGVEVLMEKCRHRYTSSSAGLSLWLTGLFLPLKPSTVLRLWSNSAATPGRSGEGWWVAGMAAGRASPVASAQTPLLAES